MDPDCWDRGIGRALILEARGRLVRQGFQEAGLWLLAGNARAERFYRIDGWTPDGSLRLHDAWGVTVDQMRYCRSLR